MPLPLLSGLVDCPPPPIHRILSRACLPPIFSRHLTFLLSLAFDPIRVLVRFSLLSPRAKTSPELHQEWPSPATNGFSLYVVALRGNRFPVLPDVFNLFLGPAPAQKQRRRPLTRMVPTSCPVFYQHQRQGLCNTDQHSRTT